MTCRVVLRASGGMTLLRGKSKAILKFPPQGPAGPTGPVGPPGSTAMVTKQVDQDVEAGQPVYVTAAGTFLLSQADASPRHRVFAVLTQSQVSGFAADATTQGIVDLPDWTNATGAAALTPGAVYFLDGASAGILTQTPTSNAFVTRVGRALSTTMLDVQPMQPIEL